MRSGRRDGRAVPSPNPNTQPEPEPTRGPNPKPNPIAIPNPNQGELCGELRKVMLAPVDLLLAAEVANQVAKPVL